MLGTLVPAQAQQIHRQTFEGAETAFRLARTDDPEARLLQHRRVAGDVHSGEQAELFVLRARGGTHFHVDYDFGKGLIFEDLTASAWISASRPGTRIMARVVLPKDNDPATGRPTELFLFGDTYEVSGRWRKLVVRRPDELLEKQRQLLQAQRKTKVEIRGAYIDKVILNLYSGIGDVAVRADDVHIGPLVVPPNAQVAKGGASERPKSKRARGAAPLPAATKNTPATTDDYSIVTGETLRVNGRPFFLRGIVRTDMPLPYLRDLGCNTMFVDWPVTSQLASEAEKLRLKLVPMLPILSQPDAQLLPGQDSAAAVDADRAAIFFHIGSKLDSDALKAAEAAVETLRTRNAGDARPISADVREGMRPYSFRLDMIGAHREPAMTTLSFDAYRRWLSQRKNLSRPATPFWTTIQLTPTEEYCRMVYGHGLADRFRVPVGPTPAQLKLMTWSAIAAGYRGIVYSSDRALSDATLGRARMLQLALLNLELTLIEPFIAEGKQSPAPVRTSNPKVAAFALRHDRAVLVLSFSTDAKAQYVVGQAAANDVSLAVESAPEAAQAFQLSLGEVRGLTPRAGLGGVNVVVPEFDTAGLVVLTTDASLYAHYQELVQQIRPRAADWQRELAEIEFATTQDIAARLELNGHRRPNTNASLQQARAQLAQCRSAFDRGDYRMAYLHGSRCMRAARLVQRDLWEAAVKDLGAPVSDPFAVSFYTLPESYRFRAGIAQAAFGENLVPSGDFERDGNLDAIGWSYRPHTTDDLRCSAMLVSEDPVEGNRALELAVVADAEQQQMRVVENTRVEMITPPVAVQPGQVVRISGYVRIPRGIAGSVDGVMVWDNIGGEALALRFAKAGGWRPFVLYRPINHTADLRVHLAVTGIGSVQFDQLAVQIADNANVLLAGQSETDTVR